MIEHVSLRFRFRAMRESKNFDSIYEIEEFVRSCHARVEDEIVFPILKEILVAENKRLVTEVLSRLEADHKLIATIGEQIRLRTVQSDAETLSKRIALYCTTVETHNTAEETKIFSFWKADKETERDATSKALGLIREFGMSRYFQMTGVSEELLRTLN